MDTDKNTKIDGIIGIVKKRKDIYSREIDRREIYVTHIVVDGIPLSIDENADIYFNWFETKVKEPKKDMMRNIIIHFFSHFAEKKGDNVRVYINSAVIITRPDKGDNYYFSSYEKNIYNIYIERDGFDREYTRLLELVKDDDIIDGIKKIGD